MGWPPRGGAEQFNRWIVEHLESPVYVSVDLDVLDPSLMSAVGTPGTGRA